MPFLTHRQVVTCYDLALQSRGPHGGTHAAVGEWGNPIEAGFERGWSDGLPVVPPTDERILRMLSATTREPQEIVGRILRSFPGGINKSEHCGVGPYSTPLRATTLSRVTSAEAEITAGCL